jgi:hypothetical protein
MTPRKRLLALAALCLVFSSCGEEQFRKETFPVTGEVYVDGEPAAELAVRCINVNGLDKEHPTTSAAFTDKTGEFEISTYEQADGVPVGDYVLTFQWGQWNRMTASYGGDKLNGRYRDPKTSEHRFTVEEGKPTELGRIELTTK